VTLELHLFSVEALNHTNSTDPRLEFDNTIFLGDLSGQRKLVDYRQAFFPLEDFNA
jgi:hypothetical protein